MYSVLLAALQLCPRRVLLMTFAKRVWCCLCVDSSCPPQVARGIWRSDSPRIYVVCVVGAVCVCCSRPPFVVYHSSVYRFPCVVDDGAPLPAPFRCLLGSAAACAPECVVRTLFACPLAGYILSCVSTALNSSVLFQLHVLSAT
jgi:hypothetical protein